MKNSIINKNKDYKAFNKNIVSLLIKNNINDAKSLINKNTKIYYIPHLYECIELVKKFNSVTNHRSYDILLQKFNEEKINWKGIYYDIVYYIKNCIVCQCKNRSVIKRTYIKQILFERPRQLFIIDLTEFPFNISKNTKYKCFLLIIDHYSKYLFGELLCDKKADTIIEKLKNIFFTTGFPEEICSRNGKVFHNIKYSQFLEKNKVKEIHGLPRKSHSQGGCERVHQTISKDLLSIILDVKNYNYNNIENDYKIIN